MILYALPASGMLYCPQATLQHSSVASVKNKKFLSIGLFKIYFVQNLLKDMNLCSI
jgi:hypothetical protein